MQQASPIETMVKLWVDKSKRTCGTCSMCCKILNIEPLNKPAGIWCKDCNPGKGCRIYDSRPQVCREFGCGWIIDADVPEWMAPNKSGVVITIPEMNPEDGDYAPDGTPPLQRVDMHVDRNATGRWRKEPYIRFILDSGARGLRNNKYVTIIHDAGQSYVVMDDKRLVETNNEQFATVDTGYGIFLIVNDENAQDKLRTLQVAIAYHTAGAPLDREFLREQGIL